MFEALSGADRRSVTRQLRDCWKEVISEAGFRLVHEDTATRTCEWTHPLSLATFRDPHTPDSLVAAVRERMGASVRQSSPAAVAAMRDTVRAMAWDTVIDWKLTIEQEAASRLHGSAAERRIERERYRAALWQVSGAVAPHRIVD